MGRPNQGRGSLGASWSDIRIAPRCAWKAPKIVRKARGLLVEQPWWRRDQQPLGGRLTAGRSPHTNGGSRHRRLVARGFVTVTAPEISFLPARPFGPNPGSASWGLLAASRGRSSPLSRALSLAPRLDSGRPLVDHPVGPSRERTASPLERSRAFGFHLSAQGKGRILRAPAGSWSTRLFPRWRLCGSPPPKADDNSFPARR